MLNRSQTFTVLGALMVITGAAVGFTLLASSLARYMMVEDLWLANGRDTGDELFGQLVALTAIDKSLLLTAGVGAAAGILLLIIGWTQRWNRRTPGETTKPA